MKSCPNPDCSNISEIPSDWPNTFYKRYGLNHNGQQVYLCKKCQKTFSLPEDIAKELNESLELDKAIYKLLVSGYSAQDILNRLDIDADYLEDRIGFIEKKSHFYEQKILVSRAIVPKINYPVYLISGNLLISIEPKSSYIVTFQVTAQPTPIVTAKLGMDEIDSVDGLSTILKSVTRKAHAFEAFSKGDKGHNAEELNKILNIIRIHINYQVRLNQKMTPAMALNITDKKTEIVNILTTKEI